MAWETVEKKGCGSGAMYGQQWLNVPCVAVNKFGITFNEPFVSAFLKDASEVLLLVDREHRKVGVRSALNSEAGGFKIQRTSGKKSRSKARHITTQHVAKAFPDCVGMAFRAHLNAGDRVIEVDLSPSNKAK